MLEVPPALTSLQLSPETPLVEMELSKFDLATPLQLAVPAAALCEEANNLQLVSCDRCRAGHVSPLIGER